MNKKLLILMVLWSFSWLPAQAQEAPAQVAAVRVPFELLPTQHMVVQVKINGKGPYRLIFDTGAPVNLLNNKVAKESGVVPKDFRPPLFAPFGSMGQFSIKTMELEGLKAHKVPTMVMDHPTVTAIAKALGPIEGIVGFSFFARFRMTLDYQARVLTFVPSDYQPPDLMDKMMKVLLAGPGGLKAKVVGAAGLWGLRVAKKSDDKEPGVDVAEVLAGSPAAAAGLQAGDRLLTLDGSWTDAIIDCHTAAGRVLPGTSAALVVRRQGKEMTMNVKVRPGL